MVKILYFSWVRDAVGIAEEHIDLPETICSAADLVDWLALRYPVFADRGKLRVAVDQVMAQFDADVRRAREIAFFPPVTGG